MRKGRDGKRKEEEEKNDVFSGHYVIASSLPPERLRPNDDRWNAARSCQLFVYTFVLVKQSKVKFLTFRFIPKSFEFILKPMFTKLITFTKKLSVLWTLPQNRTDIDLGPKRMLS